MDLEYPALTTFVAREFCVSKQEFRLVRQVSCQTMSTGGLHTVARTVREVVVMPSPAHETLVALLHERPTLINDVLRCLGRREVALGMVAGDTALRIANPIEVRPDLVLLGSNESLTWTILDVQLQIDAAKQRRWPVAAAVLFDSRGVMGDVIVLTHDASVARWAAKVARVEGPGGTVLWLQPVVVLLTQKEVDTLLASGKAELAVMAVWAIHDQTGRRARDIARAAVATIGAETDEGLRQEMLRAMISMLGDSLAKEIEELLMTPLQIKDSPVYTRIVNTLESRGEIRGEGRTLLRVLAKRGIVVDDTVRVRIETCTDVTQLDIWVDRASTATTLEAVFAPNPVAK
jgi:hypothetical protein